MDNYCRKTDLGNRGAVLVLVLLVVSALITLTVMQNERASADYGEVKMVQMRMQGYVYCSTALKALVELLRDDDNLYDSPDETWASLPVIPTPDGTISIKIVPLNSRIPLLKLLDKQYATRVEDALLRINPDMDVDGLKEYLKKRRPYSPAELFLMRDSFKIRASDMALLNTEDTDGRVNINFASQDVINAYLPELEPFSEEIVKYRQEHPFKDVSELRRVPGIDDQLYLSVQKFITVKSNRLYVHVVSTMGDTEVDVSSVFSKAPSKAKLMKYLEGVRFFYGNA